MDGKGFSKFTDDHDFEKPNDRAGLDLMNEAAIAVMNEFSELLMAFGESDEYSFVFARDSDVYDRRISKIESTIASIFTATYVYRFEKIMKRELKYLPAFDARLV